MLSSRARAYTLDLNDFCSLNASVSHEGQSKSEEEMGRLGSEAARQEGVIDTKQVNTRAVEHEQHMQCCLRLYAS